MTVKIQTLFATAFIVGFTLGISGCPNEIPDLDPGSYKILAANPKTGTMSYLGPSMERGMLLAIKEINESGGVLNKKLELVKADTHSDVVVGLQETKFYFERHQDTILGIAGASLNQVSKELMFQIAKNDKDYKVKIPIISPASSSPEFSELLDSYYNLFFRTVPSSHHQGKVLAVKAKNMGYKKGAIISIMDNYGVRLATTFRSIFNQYGSDYVANQSYYLNPVQSEILEALEKACSTSPDFLFVITYGQDGKLLLTEWARRFPEIPLILSDTLMSSNFLNSLDPMTKTALNQATVNGVFAGNDYDSQGFKKFIESFCTEYPEDCTCPATNLNCDKTKEGQTLLYVPNAYDAIYLLALGFQKTGSQNAEAINKDGAWDIFDITDNITAVTNDDQQEAKILPGEWAKALTEINAGRDVNFEGASSTLLEFDSNGDPTSGYYIFWTITDNHIEYTNSDGEKEEVESRWSSGYLSSVLKKNCNG